MQTLLNTLYLTLPGYLHLDNDTLRFEIEQETRLRVPLHHIGSVVCFGDVLISPAVMGRLAEAGKALVLLDRNGRFKARLEGPISGNILLRQAQFARANSQEFALAHAKACIAGKLKNSRYVLLRGARDANEEADADGLRKTAEALAINLRHLESAQTLDVARGLEGESARRYFAALPCLIRADQRVAFTPDGRSRRPPQDRMNALLSFLYSMLMNDCRTALECVGLDPQLGYLHAVRPGRAALALDLMEEFRSILADRLALTLVNRKQLQSDDFEERPGGAVQLHDAARKTLILAFQERKQELTSHPLLDQKLAIGLLPQIQARLLARVIRGEAEDYLPYLER
ncbi:MAG: type I-C CRISPR-associated endonuclease Cas1c [Terracidiphilus sp.]|jgi:CRISPR-associated protein Cas1